ncbi:LysR substrate-binding domain-containing protein [Zavarzinia sp.]|uniref:LysR substrate-binding domain-containing protein n=1 Tax=Zavarzinia sp. TaxID=2027920 RepID=UPI0035653D0F
MRIRDLECFRTLMLHGTMTRAAELLGLSQPAVSTIVAGLEREVGFPLFIRRAGRLHPTPEARLLYVEAARALEGIENVVRVADQVRLGKHGYLAIAAYASISISLLPRILSLFVAERPGLRTRIITRNTQGVRDLVATQQFDFAIAELPIDYPTALMDVFSYACQCMLPPDHPLAEKDVITPADLDGVPFVTLFRGDPLYQQVANAFSQYGARWNVVAETEFFSTACELVAAGCGVGIIDPVVSNPFTEDVVKRPFVPTIKYEIAILHPTHGELSQVARDFVELLKTHLAP